MRTSIGRVSRILVGPDAVEGLGEDWSTMADDGTWSDACGRAAAVVSLDGRARRVHGVLWEATRELGSHGVMAT